RARRRERVAVHADQEGVPAVRATRGMPARRGLRPDDCFVVPAARARRDVHESHPGTGPGEAPHAAHETGERGEGRAGGEASVKRGPPAAPDATTAVASTAYLLDHLAKILSVDRSKVITEAVAILTSAKKLFVYGVGRSGLAAP